MVLDFWKCPQLPQGATHNLGTFAVRSTDELLGDQSERSRSPLKYESGPLCAGTIRLQFAYASLSKYVRTPTIRTIHYKQKTSRTINSYPQLQRMWLIIKIMEGTALDIFFWGGAAVRFSVASKCLCQKRCHRSRFFSPSVMNSI